MKPRLLLVDGDAELVAPLTRLLERRQFDVCRTQNQDISTAFVFYRATEVFA